MNSPDLYTSYESIPVVLTVEEMARLLRVSRNTAYGMVRRDEVPHITVGKQIRVSRDVVLQMLGTAA